MIVAASTLFKHAYGKYACGAYNINNAEQVMGLFRGNVGSKAPFMIQISKTHLQPPGKHPAEGGLTGAHETDE